MDPSFIRLALGQLGRLVVQVIGDDGPDRNPRTIRFPETAGEEPGTPDDLPTGPADAAALMGAVKVENLGITLVNLAISTAVLGEVEKQTRVLRELQVGLDEVRSGVSELLDRTERIDLNVAEVQLRATLEHALRSAARNREVDLVLLAQLVGKALDRFFASIGGPIGPGTKRDLSLSSDVREMAEAALHFLWAARLTAIEAHNRVCLGAPLKVVRDDGVPVHLRRLSETAALVAATGLAGEMAEKVGDDLRDTWLFLGSSDSIRKSMQKQLRKLDKRLDRVDLVPQAKALLAELEGHDLLSATGTDDGDSMVVVLDEYLLAWTAHSDAGLLWRLRHEIGLQQDESYWQSLAEWMTPLPSTEVRPLGITRVVRELAG